MTEAFIPAAVLAERMGVSPDTVTRWCRQGRIPAIKPGRDWRVAATIAEDLIAAREGRGGGRGFGTEDPVAESPWRDALEVQIAQLSPGDHVLVVVPGGWDDARRFRDLLTAAAGPGAVTTVEPPPAPKGGVVTRAVLTAAARAQSAREASGASEAARRAVDGTTAGGNPPPAPRCLIRWASRIPSESLPTESRIARLSAEHGLVTYCVLPLSGAPDLATLVQTHSHVLVGTASAPCWLGTARGGSWLGMTGMTGS